jgi:hypothetical protein
MPRNARHVEAATQFLEPISLGAGNGVEIGGQPIPKSYWLLLPESCILCREIAPRQDRLKTERVSTSAFPSLCWAPQSSRPAHRAEMKVFCGRIC